MPGHRQRDAETESSVSSQPKRLRSLGSIVLQASIVSSVLLSKWAWGAISAPDLQELAAAIQMSGNSEEEVEMLASIGGQGTNEHHHRDLMAKFCKNLAIPQPLNVDVPYMDHKGDKIHSDMGSTSMFLISMWMVSLFENHREHFDMIFLGQSLEEFWGKQDWTNPKLKNHPMKRMRNFASKCIPLLIHGDGAAFHDRDSLVSVSISGLLKEGQTVDSNLLVASWPKSVACEPDTWNVLWSWIVWDLKALAANRYHAVDPFGEPLDPNSYYGKKAGQTIFDEGFFVMLYGVQGDLEYFSNDLGLPHHANVTPKPCCGWCRGNKDVHPWFDFRPDASWRTSGLPDLHLTHPLFDLPGFTLWHFCLDWMHVMDLGVAPHALGSPLWHIVFVALSHLTPAEAVAKVAQFLLEDLNSSESVHGKPITSFDLKNICDPKLPNSDYAHLRFFKAAEVRGLVPSVYRAALHFDNGTRIMQHMCNMLKHLVAMYATMHNAQIMLKREEFAVLKKASSTFLLEYSFLARDAMANGRHLFSIVPKFHYMSHMVDQMKYCNARFTWCYGGEDMVGRISRLGHSCLRGLATFKVVDKLMQKYRIAIHFRLTRM